LPTRLFTTNDRGGRRSLGKNVGMLVQMGATKGGRMIQGRRNLLGERKSRGISESCDDSRVKKGEKKKRGLACRIGGKVCGRYLKRKGGTK